MCFEIPDDTGLWEEIYDAAKNMKTTTNLYTREQAIYIAAHAISVLYKFDKKRFN